MCGVGFRAWGSGLGRGVALRFAGRLQNFSSFSEYVKGLRAGPLRFGSWQRGCSRFEVQGGFRALCSRTSAGSGLEIRTELNREIP